MNSNHSIDRHSREGGNPALSRVGGGMSLFRAAARIGWIPAFAGMTALI
jgi:hypothetical protein